MVETGGACGILQIHQLSDDFNTRRVLTDNSSAARKLQECQLNTKNRSGPVTGVEAV